MTNKLNKVKAKVGIVHPRLGFGGSEAPALWAIEELKNDYLVSLITVGPVDLQRLNQYYGTKLCPGDFTILRAPLPFGLCHTTKFGALQEHLLHRYVKRIATSFNLLISTYNPYDFGTRGIQFIANFAFDERLRLLLSPTPRGWRSWWYGDTPLRRGYLKLCSIISDRTTEGWKSNLTIANSNWTAKLLHENCDIHAPVIYPPVAGNPPYIPWHQREEGFVCIGRITPEKRMEIVIKTLNEVRQKGHHIHLHLIGKAGEDYRYAKTIKQLCWKHQHWVHLEEGIYGARKMELIARHKYGINACKSETFGIAVAEMVKAGLIVFVPNSGGQVEIVDNPALVYKDIEDAVTKIEGILRSPQIQQQLRNQLAARASRFSVENFRRAIRDIVSRFLKEASSL